MCGCIKKRGLQKKQSGTKRTIQTGPLLERGGAKFGRMGKGSGRDPRLASKGQPNHDGRVGTAPADMANTVLKCAPAKAMERGTCGANTIFKIIIKSGEITIDNIPPQKKRNRDDEKISHNRLGSVLKKNRLNSLNT